jgi:hypothetical protein
MAATTSPKEFHTAIASPLAFTASVTRPADSDGPEITTGRGQTSEPAGRVELSTST